MGAAAGRNALGGLRRPCGQVMINPTNSKKGSKYSPTRLIDFELEVALVVGRCTNVKRVSGGCGGGGGGGGTKIGRAMTTKEARGRIF